MNLPKSVFIMLCIIISIKSIGQINSFSELNTLVFAKSATTIDTFLSARGYVYKPFENTTNDIFYKEVNNDNLVVLSRSNYVYSYIISIMKYDDIFFNKMKLFCINNPAFVNIKDDVSSSNYSVAYTDHKFMYSFFIGLSNGNTVYTVTYQYRPEL
jgi:hypothetical protein